MKFAERAAGATQLAATENLVKALPFIFLLGFMNLCLAASQHPEAARGHALYAEAQGDSALFAQALAHFLVAANAGDAEAQLRVGRMYEAGEGADVDFEAATHWYSKATGLGSGEAAARLGDMYYYGRGVGTDLRRAQHYYELGAKRADPLAQASLAMMLLPNYAEAETAPEALALLDSVRNSGNTDALYLAGFRMMHRNAEGTRKLGMSYLIEAAQLGHRKAMEVLVLSLRFEDRRPLLSAEQQEWIRAEIKRQKDDANAFASERLEAIAPLVEEKRYEEALAVLDRDHRHFMAALPAWRSAYGARIWQEAQVRTGRSDPEWSWRLFEWVGYRYDEGMSTHVSARITVLGNTGSRLLEVGRIGKLRELNDRIVTTVRELDGIDFDEIFTRARWQRGRVDIRSLPLHYTSRMKHVDAPGSLPRYALQRSSMGSLRHIAEERALVGDWRKAVFVCDWIEAWAAEALAQARAGNVNAGGDIMDTLNFTLLLRAKIYEILHYPEQAEATYRGIIASDTGAYHGRTVDRAKSQLALLLARNGRTEELDLEALAELAAKQRDNQFTAESSEHIVHLAEALALNTRGQAVAARELVNGTLAFAREQQRPLLLLEALQTSADLFLANAEFAEVEAQLFEALEVARSLGLKVVEPGLYARYAAYLRQIGDIEAALAIQVELISLLKRFDAVAALPAAEAVRDALYEQYASALAGQGRRQGGSGSAADTANAANAADALTPQNGTPPSATGSAFTDGPTSVGGSASPEGGAVSAFEIDLQPVRIVSVPLPDRAVEAVFVLFNLGRQRADITLRAEGNASLAFDESATLLEVSEGGDSQHSTATATISVEGGHKQQLRVRSANVDSATPLIALHLSATLGTARISSELEFRLDGEAASTAVIDAHLLEQNPFYLIPIYHHFSNSTPKVRRRVGLRAVASEPTRIEAYDEHGNLLFIDAEGNGRFTDPGDLLAARHVNGAVPLIEIAETDRLIEFRYKVHNSRRSPAVEVHIQRSNSFEADSWHTDVIDRILLDAPAVKVTSAQ